MVATGTPLPLVEQLRVAQAQRLLVRVQLPKWLSVEKDLMSRVMEGYVERVTDRAILFTGWATTQRADYCHRCNRKIDVPESRVVGYGPDCSRKLGIIWPKGLLTESEIQIIRETIKLKTTKSGFWLPLSQTEVEILEEPRQPAGGSMPTQQEVVRIDARFVVDGGTIQVHSLFTHKDKCKSVAGARWNAKAKAWEYSASPIVANQLLDVFQGCRVVQDDTFQTLVTQGDRIVQAQGVKLAEDLPPIPCTKTAAWRHQEQAFWYIAQMWGGLPELPPAPEPESKTPPVKPIKIAGGWELF